jgi:membrane associated rhomboid family serine protease
MKDRFRSSIVWALVNGVIPALGAVLVIEVLNSVQGRTLTTRGWAAGGGAVGGCLGGVIKSLFKSLKTRPEDRGSRGRRPAP